MSVGVAVIGAGIVGGGVIQTLLRNRETLNRNAGTDIALRYVCELDSSRLEEFPLDGVKLTDNVDDVFRATDVDVVCELIGGIDPARRFVLDALKAKKHVVSANKMLIAYHGREIAETATANGVAFRYEASVAGGIPIIKVLREGLAANNIQYIYGILNGTCNYILSRMTYEGLDFDSALDQAQALGFAESPPDLDIEGHDTAHKCQILASLCYQSEVDIEAIPVEGITSISASDVSYARELGYLIKLLAVIRDVDGQIDARVHPALVPEDHLLASVRNEFNAVFVQADVVDATLYYGRGAGRLPTASAVVADIVDIARGGTIAPAFEYGPRRELRPLDSLQGRYYLRLTVKDRPGVFGIIANALGDSGVSISSCMQKEPRGDGAVHVVIMTHETVESSLNRALKSIEANDNVVEATQVLRVLPHE